MNAETKKSKKSGIKESIYIGCFWAFLTLLFFSLGGLSGCAFRAVIDGAGGPNAKIEHQEEKSQIGGGTVQEFRKPRSAQTD